MRKLLIFFIGILLLYAQPVFSDDSEQLEMALQNSLKEVLNSEEKIQWNHIKIGLETREHVESKLKMKQEIPDSLQYGMIRVDAKNFILLIDETPGKTHLFTYALYLTSDLTIFDVDVLIYRELYGGEIDDKSFREQFRQVNNPGKLIFGRTVQGITGATISSRSLTYAVRDLLLIFQTAYQSD